MTRSLAVVERMHPIDEDWSPDGSSSASRCTSCTGWSDRARGQHHSCCAAPLSMAVAAVWKPW
jgi:hypothetical protein